MKSSRADVVVLGGGLAGLAAALAFSRRGRSVLVLERDPPVVDGDAEHLFQHWERPGIAHFRQPHNFLALGRQVLREEAADVLATTLDLGAPENRRYELLPEDELLVSICARRPVFAYALRKAVECEEQVTLRRGTRVVGLLGDRTREDHRMGVNLLDPPDAIERDDELIVRAQEIARAGGVTAPAGPARTQLVETIELTVTRERPT